MYKRPVHPRRGFPCHKLSSEGPECSPGYELEKVLHIHKPLASKLSSNLPIVKHLAINNSYAQHLSS